MRQLISSVLSTALALAARRLARARAIHAATRIDAATRSRRRAAFSATAPWWWRRSATPPASASKFSTAAATRSMPRSRSALRWRSPIRAPAISAAAASWSSISPKATSTRRSTIAKPRRPPPRRPCFSTRKAIPIRQNRATADLAVGVPGTVAGLALAHQKYGSGKLSLADLLAPAIRLAEQGFRGAGRRRRIRCRAPPSGWRAGPRPPASCSKTAASRWKPATG